MDYKNKASEYWSRRVLNKPDISAVLNIGLPSVANSAFDDWFFYFLRKDLTKKMEILDAACGLGRVLVPLAKEGYSITGLDLSDEMLKTCRKNLDEAGVGHRIKLVHGSVDRLPFKNEEFDLVILSEILFHLPDENCVKAIEECSRVLKEGGLAVVTTNNKKSVFLKNISDKSQNGYFFKIRDVEEIRGFFESSGLLEIFRRSNSFTSVLNRICKIPKIRNLFNFIDRNYPIVLRGLYDPAVFIDKLKQPNYLAENLATLFYLVFKKEKVRRRSKL
ncbi:MAG: class I SAM-dependent methyltransferase [Candidatus Levyibacteriota bacterium]